MPSEMSMKRANKLWTMRCQNSGQIKSQLHIASSKYHRNCNVKFIISQLEPASAPNSEAFLKELKIVIGLLKCYWGWCFGFGREWRLSKGIISVSQRSSKNLFKVLDGFLQVIESVSTSRSSLVCLSALSLTLE